jgi:5-methylcytosine-specific restriction endonuclease McrA
MGKQKMTARKICKTCNLEKDIIEFHMDKYAKDGLCQRCKECMKTYYAENINKISERSKKYNDANKEHKSKYDKQYRIKNIEKRKAYEKMYRATNKDKLKKQIKTWQLKNAERCNMRSKKWASKHPEKTRINWQQRMARKNRLPSSLTIAQWEEIKTIFSNKCAYCGGCGELQQDHFVPLVKGGEYSHNNIIPSCKRCNASKQKSDFKDWYPKQMYYSKKRETKILRFLNYDNGLQQLSILCNAQENCK